MPPKKKKARGEEKTSEGGRGAKRAPKKATGGRGARKRKIAESQIEVPSRRGERKEERVATGWLYSLYLARLTHKSLSLPLVEESLSFLGGIVSRGETAQVEALSLAVNPNNEPVTQQVVELLLQLGFAPTFKFLSKLESDIREKRETDASEVILFQNPLLLDVNSQILYREQLQLFKPEIQTGVHTCGKCKGQRTRAYAIQLRRADEGMSYRVECVNCENFWFIM